MANNFIDQLHNYSRCITWHTELYSVVLVRAVMEAIEKTKTNVFK